MKTKIVYILCSILGDRFYEEALMSIFSARYWMPNCEIILLTDDKTNATLIGNRSEINKYLTQLIVVNFESHIQMKIRSRYLKTSIRNRVEGDFLYIDCDTIITESLHEIDNCKAILGAVLDGHVSLKDNPCYDLFQSEFEKINVDFTKIKKYFGAGVLYVKDTISTRNFFDKWHQNYLDCVSKGVTQDQLSFAITNHDFNYIITELSGEWNCQMRIGGNYFHAAKILHFISKKNMYLSSLHNPFELNQIKEIGLTKSQIKKIINIKSFLFQPIGFISGNDLKFNFSHEYKISLDLFLNEKSKYQKNHLLLLELINKNETNKLVKFIDYILENIVRIFILIIRKCI